MVNEDGTTESRAVIAAKGRDGSIWRFDLAKGPVHAVGVDAATATRVASSTRPAATAWPSPRRLGGRRHHRRLDLFGDDTWISDVQAPPPTTAPGGSTVTVEDGQLFLLRPAD